MNTKRPSAPRIQFRRNVGIDGLLSLMVMMVGMVPIVCLKFERQGAKNEKKKYVYISVFFFWRTLSNELVT